MAVTLAAPSPLSFVSFTRHSPRSNLANRKLSPVAPRASASLLPSDAALPFLRAAHHTVDTYVKSGMVVGLGSGQASGMAIQYLGRQLRAGALEDVVGIPMSVTSAAEAAKAGIPLEQSQDNLRIDFAFDDADAIEEETLVAVIGRRRLQEDDSIIQEKSILNAANEVVFMINENQYKGGLEGSVPVFVESFNLLETAEEIDDLFLGEAEVWRRATIGGADPLGGNFPFITREGHNILDVIFTSPISSLAGVAESLDKINGVVDHGVIVKTPCKVVIASERGLQTVGNFRTDTVESL